MLLGRKYVAVEHEPVLIDVGSIILVAYYRDALDIGSEYFGAVAQVEPGRAALDTPVDFVDVAQEQQRARAQVAEPGRDVLGCARVLWLQRQDDLRFLRRARRTRHALGKDVVLNGEVFIARVNLRKISDGVDRLETEAKATNRGLVLSALGDVADASDVSLIERLAEVGECEAVCAQGEGNLSRAVPVAASTEGILGVL